MKLGIFDSGIGGEAVAQSLRLAFPDADIVTVNDRHNVPYGNKTPAEVMTLTETAIQPLLAGKCDIIILACNTATAVAIEPLRERYPAQKFIGIEPMIKTAARLTKTNLVAVCATPATLASNRYHSLVTTYGSHLSIIEPDCSQWAYMIEHNQIDHGIMTSTINDLCHAGVDVIVLGCTHYHWIKDLIISSASGRAEVIEPSEAIARRITDLLS